MNNSIMECKKRIEDDDTTRKKELLEIWLSKEKNLPKISDKMLKLFLHSSYYDVEQTKRTITSYYSIKQNTPEFFQNRNPFLPNLKAASDIFYCVLLPGSTEEGYKVVMMGHKTKDTTAYKYQDVLKLFLMLIDMWLSESEQCPGYLFAIDCKNSTFGHFSAIPFQTLSKLCSYFQNGLPIRLQGLILINVSPAVNILLKCLRFLLSKRLTNLIYQFTENNENIYKHIPRKILPSEMGGESGNIDDLNDVAFQELRDHASWFQNDEVTCKQTTSSHDN